MPVADLSEAPVTLRRDGVKERRVALGKVEARLVVFPAGFTEPSACRRGHTGYVVAGTASLSIDGQARDVGAGVVLHLPPGTDHRLTTAKGCTLLLFDSRE
ncbi:MAG TPA: cupin domain-containing protein [Candidatus Thermoplasmatota archaeon]|nr:cupin domain-containing protein [Candidatus Thermoplasmatota archaeon]